ncbi:hypothetical protein F3Y22_tig00111792pilonHSYRG00027 [Hibiscus syriacus]|uniref:DNA (Cytosine-5)-methyltransferase DRM1/2 n=1 Tax=Hibiscus syriacus TaxID=106335 RepID=A0A6A2YF57_HIBSY|nr:hypothetical protein F3Y22_tig00111792pilonHSYRG00027 [Hibiscus syriacus]
MQHVDSDNYSSDYEVTFQDDFTDIDSSSDIEEILNSDSDEENKLLYLTKMGFSEAEASIAMERCGSAKLTERIRKALETYDNEPPSNVQKYVLDECRKWNLVWAGRNKVVQLQPDEVKMLLSFPKNHTQRGGSARDMFPDGINVLSLFSRISGTEVAFYYLGIPLKVNMQEMNGDQLEQLMSRFGEFDLVIGGINLIVSSVASRNTSPYSTLPEPCKGLVEMDIMDIILARKMIDMEEAAMMYQDLTQYHGITRVQVVTCSFP